MPSRKLKFACPKCSFKNEVGSRFCNQCGVSLPEKVGESEIHDAKAEHRDIAHPVTQEFREYLQKKILEAFKLEAEKNPSQVNS